VTVAVQLAQQLPVWVLNLERASSRRTYMVKQLEKLGLKYKMIVAVDGRNLSRDELAMYSPNEAIKHVKRELVRGEIGCALSHARLWDRIVEGNIPEVLVLEDDVVIGEMLLHVLNVRDKYPDDWEFINYVTDVKQVPFGEPVHSIYRMCKFKEYANRTGVYLVNRKGAEKLLNNAFPVRFAADGLTGRTSVTNLISYGIYPKVAALANFKSNIWENERIW